GEHEGGYTPFDFDVTDRLKPGANELLVRVVDPPMDERGNRARFPSMIYNEIPHGKQNWYVQTGGIWQAASLKILPRVYIERLHVTPRINGDFSLEITLRDNRHEATGKSAYSATRQEGPPPLSRLGIIIRDPDGKLVYRRNLVSTTAGQHTFQGNLAYPRLWTPDKPSLYTVEVGVIGIPGDGSPLIVEDALSGRITAPDSSEINQKQESFGFRSFEARDGKFYLNGEPFYMIAALDQDFYPETVYTAPSEEYVRDAMRKAKKLGLNTLRCHIKVCEPVYLKVADEEGLLVWYEIPSWNDQNHFTLPAAERGERVLQEMTERDWNHPSIVIQSIINESWGADLKKPEQRRWLREAFERAKKLTTPRGILVVDNSACCDNFHVKTDINDFHQYFSQPDNHERWDKWVADFSTRPAWTFSPHGDAETSRREPLVVSEFGNWGLPKLPLDLPWWFARDFGGREVTRPAGVLDRFREFHLSTLFRDYNALAEATEWHQFRSLKHEIEEIRRYGSIQGYVITEFTDINWEANGLMDMWRNPKAYADELRKLQQPDVVTARTDKRNYTSGEQVRFEALLSHYSHLDLKGAELLWHTETEPAPHRHKIGPSVVSAGSSIVGRHLFTAPEVESPRRERIVLEVLDSMGALAAESSAEVFIYPKTTAMKTDAARVLTLHDPKNSYAEFGGRLSESGYDVRVSRAEPPTGLVLASTLDDFVMEHLRKGGRAVILADSKQALPAAAPVKVVP
ncbi:MAG TPA: glycoside hydrolase family 2 TIM barrel-domain containing protein, partial [Pyrinomonadaceae bacterium]|nr:glycoside hydrolase family 2 TIM barrel-domain containing protein [Pyrinomonadaceae bacterium]